MIQNFAETIAPIIKEDIAISKTPDFKAYIAEQESKKEKELKKLNKETERETRRICEKYDKNISVAKKHMAKKI